MVKSHWAHAIVLPASLPHPQSCDLLAPLVKKFGVFNHFLRNGIVFLHDFLMGKGEVFVVLNLTKIVQILSASNEKKLVKRT